LPSAKERDPIEIETVESKRPSEEPIFIEKMPMACFKLSAVVDALTTGVASKLSSCT
jgi:hypothetical protein